MVRTATGCTAKCTTTSAPYIRSVPEGRAGTPSSTWWTRRQRTPSVSADLATTSSGLTHDRPFAHARGEPARARLPLDGCRPGGGTGAAATAGRRPERVSLVFHRQPLQDLRRFSDPFGAEVAAVFVGRDGVPPDRELVVYPRGDRLRTICCLSAHADPLISRLAARPGRRRPLARGSAGRERSRSCVDQF